MILQRPLSASLLVVRGCISCIVSTSSDGRRFTAIAREPFGATDDVLVHQMRGMRVAAIRVETDTGGFFTSLREVSVFATSPG